MKKLMTPLKIIPGSLLIVLAGCYTQFGSILDKQDPVVQEGVRSPDSTSARVDTVRVKEREVCYWSRDLLGYPVLRCDRSYYPRDWYLYHSSPWWYRNDAFWYDYDRCPRYYYFDPSCGCCRYYTEGPNYTPPSSGGSGSGGKSSSGYSAPSRTSRTSGIPRTPPPSAAPQPLPKSTQSAQPAPVQRESDATAGSPVPQQTIVDTSTAEGKAPLPPPVRRSTRGR